MAASPICTVKDGAGAPAATTNGVNVTAGNTITIALVSSAGVSSWAITCIGTDELQAATTINAGLTVDGVNKTATFTMPANGTALGFQSSVTDSNGVTVSTTFGIYTLTNSLRVGFVGETIEGSAAFGYTATVNAKIRQAAGGGGSTLPVTVPASVTKSANYTIVPSTDYLVVCVTTPGITITLPASPAANTRYEIKNITGGNISVAAAAGFDGGASPWTVPTGMSITVTWVNSWSFWFVT